MLCIDITYLMVKEIEMKKTLFGLMMVAAMVTGVFAEGSRELVTVEGKLVFTDSVPTIVGADKVWLLPPGPFYQIAYENSIKAGDTIKAEGYERDVPSEVTIKDAKFFMPTKVSVNGKAIDLSTFRERGMMGGRDGRGGRGGMMRGDRQCGDRDFQGSRGN